MRIAVIDMGTNTFHLLLVEAGRNATWKKILHKRITVKLGQRGIDKKIITNPAYRRGMHAIGQFKKTIDEYKIKKVFAFGTAALRSASNGSSFLKEIKSDYGIHVKVISGMQEAELIYLGVKQAVKMNERKALIMDIGGGSVEFIIADGKKISWKGSYKLGAALMLEKFKPSDPVTNSEIRRIHHHLDSELESLFEACRKFRPVYVIGSAGSFETFASMIQHRFPESGSHYGKTEHPIAIKHFQQLYKELIISTFEDRKHMKGLIKMRVDMIVLAALLLKFVLAESKIKEIRLSSYSLKEGALWSVLKSEFQ